MTTHASTIHQCADCPALVTHGQAHYRSRSLRRVALCRSCALGQVDQSGVRLPVVSELGRRLAAVRAA